MRPRRGEGTFVVHCSSSLYQPYFQDFLRQTIGVRNYGLLALPGGVQSLTLEKYLPKFAWSGWRHIKFLMDLDEPARIILIGHDDCRWYHRGPIERLAGPERTRQEKDLRSVAASWKTRFPNAAVEAYYATLQQGKANFDGIH